ncbi:MAG TPA: toast rack family protein, partial [Anaerolineales bacterium]|nr:toast rack family protein [Anaerolineales bacterium]
MNTKMIAAILVLALASLACGFNINIPERHEAGPEIEESISVADPESDETRLSLEFGAGTLRLSPGAENLVDGTVVYNVDDLKPEIEKDGNRIELRQGDLNGLPPFDEFINDWDLHLGDAPLDLAIQAGAYEGNMELGGLALRSLTVRDGASDVELSFKEPNQTKMSILRYETGASKVTLTGLANANFSTLTFSGGAGNYTLDFSGELQRDAVVTIEAGFGDLSLVIPEDVDAAITVEGTAVNINHSSGWSQNGKT